jgi:hypothetical protein
MGSKISKKKKMKINGFKNLKKEKDENQWVQKSPKKKMKINGFKNLKKEKDENQWVQKSPKTKK